ncbi:MAG: hypothetical protein V2A79_05990 [Planctomycetota bacterium]
MNDSDLLRRLTAIRAAIRWRLVLYGLCGTVSGGLLAFTLMVFLDWWLWLPSLLRLALTAVFALGGAGVAAHWIIRPLLAPFKLSELAGKLERHFPDLSDRLTSTVGFLSDETVPTYRESCGGSAPRFGSQTLVRRVIDDTAGMVRQMPLEAALTLRPLVRCAAACLLLVTLATVIAWASPGWYRTGGTRYALPYRPMEWPRRVEIQPLQRDTKVAFGGALLVRMRVLRGLDDDLRAIVRVRDAAGGTSIFAMQREEAADFYGTIDAITGDLAYWFEAGDADTAHAPCRVIVVQPPAVADATLRVAAPAYAQPRAAEERDLAGGEIRAVIGSTLTVQVRSSKPVGLDNQGRPMASLEFDEAPPVPLALEDDDPTRLSGAFELRQNDAFRMVLKDAEGFENTARRDYRLIAAADEPPTVVVTEPAAVTEVTPTGSVTLVARADDDFGIQQIRLVGELLNRSQEIDLPLADHPPVTPTGGRRSTELRRVWELAPLKLQAGDVVIYRFIVTDNYAYAGAPGQSTTSPPLRLKLVAQAEFENRLRDDFALLEARVRQALLDQEGMRDELHTLAADVIGGSGPARRLARVQSQLADQVRRLAERFDRVAERVRLNHAFDEQTRKQTTDAAAQLGRSASGSMAQAARALERLADPRALGARRDADSRSTSDSGLSPQPSALDSAAAQAELATAATSQKAAVDELQQVLRWMGRWSDFQEMVAKTRDLLDRQQQVRAAALRQGRTAVGKAPDTLNDEERARLKRVVREERQLAQDMDQWLRKARSLIEPLRAKDAPSAEALENALRAAAAQQVLPRMEKAADALSDNRIAAASIEQRAVEAGLTTVLTALEARQARELAELRKTLERLVDAVAELLRAQEALVAAVQEAAAPASQPVGPAAQPVGPAFQPVGPAAQPVGPAAQPVGPATQPVGPATQPVGPAFQPVADFADEQRAIRRNTRQLGDQVSESPAAAKAAGELAKAVPPMERAEEKLRVAAGEQALVDQGVAIAALRAALAELELLAAQTDHRLMQMTLVETRRKLEELRNQQEQVNAATGELVETMRGQTQLSRTVTRRASALAAQQDGIRNQTVALRRELENTAVYTWVLDRVTEKMSASREALVARRLEGPLVESQRDIVSELARLIDALASIEALPPPSEFAEGEGGGGDAAAANQPPVPPVAELIVIKTMQEALHQQTAALHTARSGSEPTEEDLRRARAIGQEQEQLRELTVRVVRQARRGD